MPRLIDNLRAKGAKVVAPHFVPEDKREAWAHRARETHELMMDAALPVLLIDNVAEYYFTSDQEYWDLRTDFPNLAPPFPAFWCEHRIVKTIHSKECGDSDVTRIVPHGRVGMLFHAVDPANIKAEDKPDNLRWVLYCELFIDYGIWRDITAHGPHGSTFFLLDKEGQAIEPPQMYSLASDSDFDREMARGYMTWFNPALLAISFLHCKNVTLVDNRVDAPLAKKFKARHGIMPCTYKTLVIEPLKKVLRTEGRSGEVGIQKALHICRGHFKDYREGRGLFGKYHQLVWHPAIVRGSRGDQAPPREIEVKV